MNSNPTPGIMDFMGIYLSLICDLISEFLDENYFPIYVVDTGLNLLSNFFVVVEFIQHLRCLDTVSITRLLLRMKIVFRFGLK